jgi:hypothetical protein
MEFEQHRSKKVRGAELKPEEGGVMQDGGSAAMALEDMAELQTDDEDYTVFYRLV